MTNYIQAKVKYYQLEGGFWGITSDKGVQYYPINFPEQLKINNITIHCSITSSDEFTSVMWGEPVKIISFETTILK